MCLQSLRALFQAVKDSLGSFWEASANSSASAKPPAATKLAARLVSQAADSVWPSPDPPRSQSESTFSVKPVLRLNKEKTQQIFFHRQPEPNIQGSLSFRHGSSVQFQVTCTKQRSSFVKAGLIEANYDGPDAIVIDVTDPIAIGIGSGKIKAHFRSIAGPSNCSVKNPISLESCLARTSQTSIPSKFIAP